jgi:hypothetical protein
MSNRLVTALALSLVCATRLFAQASVWSAGAPMETTMPKVSCALQARVLARL